MKEQVQLRARWSESLPDLLPARTPGESHLGEARSNFWSDFNPQRDRTGISGAGDNLDQERSLTILVPMDFTASSLVALDCAFRIAQTRKSQVTLLHALYLNLTPYGPANVNLIEQQMRDAALTTISNLLPVLNRVNVPVRSVILKGKPSTVINEYIRKNAVDLAILTPHKHSGLGRFLSPKTAETVIREASCPVLVVSQ